MIAQFEQDLCDKNFSLQDHGKVNQTDTLQNRIKFWLNIIDMGGPILDSLYDCDHNNDGLYNFARVVEIFLEIGELEKLLEIFRDK